MAINRYDQPAQVQYKNTYVPIPFDEMMKIGQMTSQRVEQGEQTTADYLAKVNDFLVAPGKDESEYRDRVAKIEENVASLGEKYSPGSLEYRRGMMKEMANQSRDSWWRDARQNYKSYWEGNTAVNEAKAKGAAVEDYYDLQQGLNTLYTKGSSGMREETGSGLFVPGAAYENIDYREPMEKMVDNVKPSSAEYDQSTGQYIFTTKNAGTTANQLGGPLGLVFETSINKETGRPELTLDYTKSSPSNAFLSSPAGAKVIRKARYNVDNGITERGLEEEVKALYVDEALSVVKERVHSDSSVTMNAEPYAMAKFKNDMANFKIPITQNIIMGTEAKGLDSASKIHTAQAALDIQTKEIQDRRNSYIKNSGVSYADKGDGRLEVAGTDYENSDVSLVMAQFDAEIKQVERKKTSLNNAYKRALRDPSIPVGWSAKEEDMIRAKDAASKAKDEAVMRWEVARAQSGDRDAAGKAPNFTEVYDNAYRVEMRKLDPTYGKIDDILKKNAEQESMNVGVTTISDKVLEEQMSKLFNTFYTEGETTFGKLGGGQGGLTTVGDKRAYSPSDYKDLSSEEEARVEGWAYDPESSNLKLIWRPYSKNGELKEAVMADAPEGLERWLVQNGQVDEVKVNLRRQLAEANATVDDSGTMSSDNIGLDSSLYLAGYEASIHRLTASERALNPEAAMWEIRLPALDDSGKVVHYKEVATSETELINKFLRAITLIQ